MKVNFKSVIVDIKFIGMSEFKLIVIEILKLKLLNVKSVTKIIELESIFNQVILMIIFTET